ncbi:MAG: membrane protein insertion efficiency factor YidD [Limisphaerales bacterium]
MSDVCQTGAAAFGGRPHPLISEKKSGGRPAAAAILIFAIRAYRWTVSPAQTFLFGPAGGCRFTPTCSQYAMDAIRTHGARAGGWMGLKRICRCHPWGRCGHDPAPKAEGGRRKAETGVAPEHSF